MIDRSNRRWVGLVFISLAVSLIIVDSTIVNVAVPSIVDELKITSTEVQWVQEAYTLVSPRSCCCSAVSPTGSDAGD